MAKCWEFSFFCFSCYRNQVYLTLFMNHFKEKSALKNLNLIWWWKRGPLKIIFYFPSDSDLWEYTFVKHRNIWNTHMKQIQNMWTMEYLCETGVCKNVLINFSETGHLMWRADSLKRPDTGKDWKPKERGWQRMRWLVGITDSINVFEQTPGDSEGQGSLGCYSQPMES